VLDDREAQIANIQVRLRGEVVPYDLISAW